jgi:8-oxo-dGTP diphosphatase
MIDVVCGVICVNQRYLITQRGDIKHFGKWEFPGGKVKEGEDIFTSVKREIFEELNLDILPVREITRYSFENLNLIFILCECLNDNTIQLTEHINFEWSDITDFDSYDFLDGDKKFIQSQYLKKITL